MNGSGNDAPDLGPVGRCHIYWRGHDIHWIPVFKAVKEPGPVLSARVLSIEDGVITVAVAGGVRRYWNHDPDRLARALDLFGPDVEVQDKWGFLRVPHGGSAYLFSVVRLESDGSPPAGTVTLCRSSVPRCPAVRIGHS